MGPDYGVSNARGLVKDQLGGVIFITNKTTINECLSKQLFGLPGSHFRYVKKIKPGLPLFLFNSTDRTLHGIFEAASSGKMNIDPYAWIFEGSQRTKFPAQVRICVNVHGKVLTENQFKPTIFNNYYNRRHFWFELDHAQTSELLLLFLMATQAVSDPRATLTPTIKPFEKEHLRNIPVETVGTHLNGSKSFPLNLKDIKTHTTLAPCTTPLPRNKLTRVFLLEKESVCHMPPESIGGHLNSVESFPSSIKYITTCKPVNKKELITTRIKDLAQKRNLVASDPPSSDCEDESAIVMNNMTMEKKEDISYRVIFQLLGKNKDLRECKAAQSDKIIYLERKIALMEQNMAQAQPETKNLKGTCNTTEVQSCVGRQKFDDIKGNESIPDSLPDDSIFLIGGYDGVSWLSSLDCYSPSQNLTKSLSPMLTERCYAAVSKLDGELFVFGGGTRGQRLNTVESFDPVKNRWRFCPPLNQKNENLAGATLKDKIYALGGGKNDVDSYSSVEMLDFDVGAWIPTRSMLQKRFSLAAAELHGALYAVGGFDGSNYLSSAERFDPRERGWKKIESMTTARGCPSMVVLNEKLFVLGGYDGNAMVSTVEIYDPRRGSWMIGEPMNHPRGFSAAAVVKDCVYIFGGLRNDKKINETVECYKEGQGWEVTNGACQRHCMYSNRYITLHLQRQYHSANPYFIIITKSPQFFIINCTFYDDFEDAIGLGIILCKKAMEFEDENKGLMAKLKVVSRTTVEGLPEGWIKEFRTRKREVANRKDPFCLDPSSDYALELNTTSVMILRSVLNISADKLALEKHTPNRIINIRGKKTWRAK